MKGIVRVWLLMLALGSFRASSALRCFSCEGGVKTTCAQVLSLGADEVCSGPNPQCYEAYVEYQNGALTLIQRRCWTPPKGSNETDFCKSFDNPNGRLGKCITCETDLCNTDLNFWKQ